MEPWDMVGTATGAYEPYRDISAMSAKLDRTATLIVHPAPEPVLEATLYSVSVPAWLVRGLHAGIGRKEGIYTKRS